MGLCCAKQIKNQKSITKNQKPIIEENFIETKTIINQNFIRNENLNFSYSNRKRGDPLPIQRRFPPDYQDFDYSDESDRYGGYDKWN
jgi:hypothetical protein